jgi:16S rRNA (cytosine967-C5)-methyltransferase
VTVLPMDGRTVGRDPDLAEESFDRVLVDAPCTGLGSLRRRPEARWRRTPADLPPLTKLQRELLVAALRAVRPGGVVAYVTCSPHMVETQVTVTEGARRSGVEVDFVDARPLLPPGMPKLGNGPTVQLWPHRHGTDAMFLAMLRRTA